MAMGHSLRRRFAFAVFVAGSVLATQLSAQVTTTGGVSNIVGSVSGATQNVLSLGEIGAGSDGEVLVSGSGTIINFFDVNQLTAGVTVGTQSHTGRLVINNGATVFSTATVPGLDNAFVHISRSADGVSNSALGTVVIGDDPLTAGVETQGFMTITSNNADAYLGVGRTGPGVLDLNNSELRIRALGPGSGAAATADSAVFNIGDTATSTAVGTVTATDSVVLVEATGGGNATVSVGRRTDTVANPDPALAPESTLLLEGGTVMDIKSVSGVAQISVGRDGARGRATIDGNTTVLNVEDLVRVGRAGGHGTMTVQNGAAVDNHHVGKSSETRVGESGGTGTLNVNTGASYAATQFIVGGVSGSSGTINISGSGSALTASGTNESTTVGEFDGAVATVGANGTGSININSGGQMTVAPGAPVNGGLSGGMVIGGNRSNPDGTGDGTVNVDGVGSSLVFSNSNSSAGNIQIGRDGTGVLNITNGGLVDSATQNVAAIGRKAGGDGTVNVTDSGSTWNANQVTIGLNVSLPSGSTISGLGGNGTLNVADGGLVTAGNILVAGQGKITGGGGTIRGNITVGDDTLGGGTLGPGNSPGLMQVLGNVDLLGGSTMILELGGLVVDTGYDRLDVADDPATTGVVEGNLSLAAGTIFDIDYFGAFTASDGDSFDVLVADDISGASITSLLFDFSGAALALGLHWETSIVDFGGGREALRLTAAADQVPVPNSILFILFGTGFTLVLRQLRISGLTK
ncbi:MAG: hypothetical protein GKS01_19170 [Alphaproteobacteria bacterium]|nr:hypothetical protein [Alphaproteobacteria bacterium]